MSFYYFTSSDSGAPALSGTNGTFVTLLDWILVTKGGWTQVYSGTNKAVYRAPSGNRFYLRVVHDSAVSGSAQRATVRGYESMSGIDTGTDPFPTVAQQSDANSNWSASQAANSGRGEAQFPLVVECRRRYEVEVAFERRAALVLAVLRLLDLNARAGGFEEHALGCHGAVLELEVAERVRLRGREVVLVRQRRRDDAERRLALTAHDIDELLARVVVVLDDVGIDAARALFNDYFNNFYSDAERNERALQMLSETRGGALEVIGLDPNTTAEQFRARFEAAMATLSPEDTVQWLEAD